MYYGGIKKEYLYSKLELLEYAKNWDEMLTDKLAFGSYTEQF